MGVINIKALFDWKQVQTGLQNIKGQFQRVGAEVDKGFSLGSIARNFIGGFVGVNLAAKLVEPFKQAAAYAERIAQATASLREITVAGFMARNTPERNLQLMSREMQRNDTRLADIDTKLAELPDFSDPNWIKLGAQNPDLLNPFIVAAKKGQYDSLITEREDLQAKQQTMAGERANLERQTATAARQQGYERSGIYDERRVARGEMSRIEALQAAADRASQEYLTVLRTRGPGVETDAAFNTLLRAQNALIPAEAQAERLRLNGVLPQISSSSLAQLGGGGNVNVFGGRPGEGLSELREQTRLLREISNKVGGGGPTVALDVGT